MSWEVEALITWPAACDTLGVVALHGAKPRWVIKVDGYGINAEGGGHPDFVRAIEVAGLGTHSFGESLRVGQAKPFW